MNSKPLIRLALLLSLAFAPRSIARADGDLAPSSQTALAAIDQSAEELKQVNRSIWKWAELGLQETQSAGLLVDKLRQAGFEVKTGVAGMPTAFVASYGSGKPVVGILAEYDALPGMSQAVAPERQPLEPGGSGHACGHSGLGTAALGAALAVKEAYDRHRLKGTVRLYGTPAEETGIGKVYMLLDGAFDDLDVCLHWHPGKENRVAYAQSKAVVSVKYTFRGIPAHAASSPESGRSALDAVELMNVGVNYMREHVKEDARMHYVITDGGGQPNVVPPEAQVWYYIRADDHKDAEYYFEWIKEIAEAAAKMTRTELAEVYVNTDNHEIIPNLPLSERILEHMKAVGPPTFTEEEKSFARQLQQPLRAAFNTDFPVALEEEIKPLDDEPFQIKGSTDVGDVSWHVPTGGLGTVCFIAEAPGHSWQNVATIGSSIGEKGTLAAAKVMALTAIDCLQDPELLTKAREDFKERMKDREYKTLIPEGQKAPRSIR
jgi:aminobenzoyl-glutamate utilization protein B